MKDNIISEKIKQIEMENYIWIIYIAIIVTSWYANKYEKDYFLNNNLESRDKYQNSLVFIFTILLIVYIFFFRSSLDDINNLKAYDTDKKKELTYLSSIGSLLILISGIIFLYIATSDKEIDVELAFN